MINTKGPGSTLEDVKGIDRELISHVLQQLLERVVPNIVRKHIAFAKEEKLKARAYRNV